MIQPEAVVSLYHQRKHARAPQIDRMLKLQRQVDGDVMVPLPELDKSDKPGIANLIALGLDQFSQRVGSVSPDIFYPPLRPGIAKSENKARDRRLAALGWWDMNKMDLKRYKRARFLLGYGCAPVTIHPVSQARNDHRDIPFWRIRNPLACFPAPCEDDTDMEPADYIISHSYPLGWLEHHYPLAAGVLYKGRNTKQSRDAMFEVLEYNDADETVLVAIGAERTEGQAWDEPGMGSAAMVELDRVVNRTGMCLMVLPGRITLHKLAGHFDSMIHLFTSQAKMAAYEELAIFRSVFPEEWVVSHPNAPTKPKIARDADGKQGIIGIIENGVLQSVPINPGAQVPTAIDRLERASRLAGGIPAEFGGESPTNIRTARRGESVLGAAVDMPLQEYQEILAASAQAELVIAAKTMKAYYGSKPTSFYLGRDGKVMQNDYVPNTAFEIDFCEVKFAFPGADAAAIPIEIGQRIGTGEMSKQTAREMDPAIEDPIRERDQVYLEGLAQALLTGLEQQMAQPGSDPTLVAKLAAELDKNHPQLWTAYLTVHDQLQKEQAATAQAPPGSPEQMPGAAPGGAPPPGTAIGPAAPSQQDLAGILQTLRRPANQGQPEKALAAAPGQ